jgi:SAM-dependent methyltransferase
MALYDSIGRGYAVSRRPDARIAAIIDAALGDARSVVNIGAGTGSYEPQGRAVIAVEPSEVMIGQRPPGSAPCLKGFAEALPLADGSVDAAMAILSLHHWRDPVLGIAEMARVARSRAVVLTWVPDAAPFWLTRDYFPEILAHDLAVFPASADLVARFERSFGRVGIVPVPVPHDCVDGFVGAFWRRPDAYLRAEIRGGMSSFSRFESEPGLARLREDLAKGAWARINRAILNLDMLDVGYRLLVCEEV